MEWIQSMLDSGQTPFVAAILLGLLTALSPCPLATNITAIGYISKDIENKHRVFWGGILYTLGRVITYSVLGFVLIFLLRKGAEVFSIQDTVSKYGELILPPALILIGLFMLFGHKLKLPKFGYKGSGEVKGRSNFGALLLGMLFALAFCPTSGFFFFGSLIPLSVDSNVGYLLPVVYAIATGLPVIVVAWILAYSVSGVGKFYHRMKTFQRWFSLIVALLFIAVGIYYAIVVYF